VIERLEGSFPAGADISVGKALTAVMFRRPTRALEEIINKGRSAMIPVAAVTAFTPLQGGIPITINGHIVGGIGVSGAASAQQDEEIAIAGAQAFEQTVPAASVQYVAADQLSAAFSQGQSGGTVVERPEFRVNASRRDGPGEAEVHVLDTDIFYVLQGEATLVTGGELVEARAQSSVEQRGSALQGGTAQHIRPGDVVTIPRGVPHWFKSVTTPFKYLVVKAVSGAAS
jgi:glc operon protein GlcG